MTKTVNVTIKKVDSTLTVGNITFDYDSNGSASVSFTGANGIVAEVVGHPESAVKVNGNEITVSGLDVGNYTLSVTTVVDDNHNNVTKFAKITVNKVDSSLVVGDVELDYGGSVDVKVTFEGATGITAKIDNSIVNVSGSVITISGLSAGTHSLTVTTIADVNHNDVSKTVDVTVRKVDSTLTVGNITFDYDSNGSASVSFTGANSIVAWVLNQNNAVVNVKGNVITVSGLDVGNYTLSVTTVADTNHNNVTKFAKITVNKIDSSLVVGDVELDYGGSVDVKVTFEGATGITAKIDNDDVNVSGKVIPISGLSAGTHALVVTTIPDNNHFAVNKTATITVNKIKSSIVSNNLNASVNQELNLTANVFDSNNFAINQGSVTFFDGENELGKADVVNGVATFTYIPSKVGNHIILMVYDGSMIYESSNSSFVLSVIEQSNSTNTTDVNSTTGNATGDNGTDNVTNITKISPDLTVSVSDVNVGENVTVNISINEKASGKVTLTVGNVDYDVVISNGKGIVNVPGLAEGSYSVLVRFAGDDYYLAENKTASFRVIKFESPVNETNATGNVTGGNSTSGNATGNATGDNGAGNVTNVTKLSPNLDVAVVDVNVGDAATVNVSINEKATGKVTVTVNNVDYVVCINDGKGIVHISNLAEGSYSVLVKFAGDDYYLAENKNASFRVIKVVSPINETNTTDNATGDNSTSGNATGGNGTGNVTNVTKVSPDLKVVVVDVNVGDVAAVNVSINEKATGKVILTVGNVDYDVVISNGKGIVNVPGLAEGSYSVLVEFAGDDYYLAENKNASFRVIKVVSPINETNATGNVTGGNSTSGNATGNATGDNGTGDVTNVTKLSPGLGVDVVDINVGEVAVVTISINEKATGKVTLTVGNVDYVVSINDGKGMVHISNLAEGSYSVLVKFEGDDYFNADKVTDSFKVIKVVSPVNETNTTGNATGGNSTSGNATGNATGDNGTGDVINITKLNPDLTVDVVDINVGEVAVVNVLINEKATGKVTLTVNNVDYDVVISNGKGIVNVPGLAEGSYSVLVKFAGDDYYLAENKTASFRVIKVESPINETNTTGNATVDNSTSGNATGGNGTGNVTNITKISPDLAVSVSDVNVGENVMVNIFMNEKITGKVTLTVDNVDYVASINDGKGLAYIPNLAEGSYSVLVKFEGDDYYIAENKTASFKVIKAESPINETNATGNATVDNSTSGNATGGNGTGNVTNITKLIPDLTVDAADINVGEIAIVNISINENATGKVTVRFNDVESLVEISNGKGTFTILNLAEGNYSVLVKFAGDEHYLAGNKTALFTVTACETPVNDTNATTGNETEGNMTNITKESPDLSINVSNVTVGKPVVVDISVNENVTCMVSVSFNGVESVVGISNGKGSYSILDLAVGNYSVLVKFAGDDQFNACEITALFSVIASGTPVNGTSVTDDNSTSGNATGNNTVDNSTSGNATGNNTEGNETNVTKLNPDLTISAKDITVGETATVFIEINANATGRVTVGGENINITNGKATFTIAGLAAGKYNVTVVFEGDDLFSADSKTATINVSKVEMPIGKNPFNVDKNKIVESTAPVYSINLPGDATGNLTVIVAGKAYTKKVVNGTASIRLNLPPGDYNVTVAYSGDDKYAPVVVNVTTKVVVDPKVVMNKTSVLYTGKYSVTVYGKDGKVAKDQDVVFYVDGKKIKTVKTNSKGVASFKIPSKYLPNKKITIKATALGKSASKKVNVRQILSIKKVKVKKSARKLVLTATLKKVDGKYLKGKKITFKFNGKKIKTVKTNKKGVAKVTVKKSLLNKLKVGKKVTYKATYLKTTVKKTVKVIR